MVGPSNHEASSPYPQSPLLSALPRPPFRHPTSELRSTAPLSELSSCRASSVRAPTITPQAQSAPPVVHLSTVRHASASGHSLLVQRSCAPPQSRGRAVSECSLRFRECTSSPALRFLSRQPVTPHLTSLISPTAHHLPTHTSRSLLPSGWMPLLCHTELCLEPSVGFSPPGTGDVMQRRAVLFGKSDA